MSADPYSRYQGSRPRTYDDGFVFSDEPSTSRPTRNSKSHSSRNQPTTREERAVVVPPFQAQSTTDFSGYKNNNNRNQNHSFQDDGFGFVVKNETLSPTTFMPTTTNTNFSNSNRQVAWEDQKKNPSRGGKNHHNYVTRSSSTSSSVNEDSYGFVDETVGSTSTPTTASTGNSHVWSSEKKKNPNRPYAKDIHPYEDDYSAGGVPPQVLSHMKRRRQKYFAMIALVVTAVVLVVVGVTMAVTKSSSSAAMLEKPCPQDFLQKLQTVQETELTVTLLGRVISLGNKDDSLERPQDQNAQMQENRRRRIMERAVVEAYNNVSALCHDKYERWMYDAWITNEQPTTDYANRTAWDITFVTTMSCRDCPLEESFASEFGTAEYTIDENESTGDTDSATNPEDGYLLRRLNNQGDKSIFIALPSRNSRQDRHRNLGVLDTPTIYARDVIYAVEERLVHVEPQTMGVSGVEITTEKSLQKHLYTGKGTTACSEEGTGKGKGKSSKGGRKLKSGSARGLKSSSSKGSNTAAAAETTATSGTKSDKKGGTTLHYSMCDDDGKQTTAPTGPAGIAGTGPPTKASDYGSKPPIPTPKTTTAPTQPTEIAATAPPTSKPVATAPPTTTPPTDSPTQKPVLTRPPWTNVPTIKPAEPMEPETTNPPTAKPVTAAPIPTASPTSKPVAAAVVPTATPTSQPIYPTIPPIYPASPSGNIPPAVPPAANLGSGRPPMEVEIEIDLDVVDCIYYSQRNNGDDTDNVWVAIKGSEVLNVAHININTLRFYYTSLINAWSITTCHFQENTESGMTDLLCQFDDHNTFTSGYSTGWPTTAGTYNFIVTGALETTGQPFSGTDTECFEP